MFVSFEKHENRECYPRKNLVKTGFWSKHGQTYLTHFQGEERPSEKGEKQLELGPMSGESKLIVPHFQICLLVQRPPTASPAGH